MKHIKQIIIDRYAAFFLVIAIILLAYAGFGLHENIIEINRIMEYQQNRLKLSNDLEDVSNKFTDLARSFASNYNLNDLNEYWYEINVEKTKDKIISRMTEIEIPEEEKAYLLNIKESSDELEMLEIRSMYLIFYALNYDLESIPTLTTKYILSEEEMGLPKEKKLELARYLVFEEEYREIRREIRDNLSQYRKKTEQKISEEINIAIKNSNDDFDIQKIFILVIFFGGSILLLFYYTQITLPIINYTSIVDLYSKKGELPVLVPKGSMELYNLAEAFNKNTEEIIKTQSSLIETENKLKLHIHLMPLAAIEYDCNFVITHWNKAAEKIFGFTKEETIGKKSLDIIIPADTISQMEDIMYKLNLGDSTADNVVNKNLTKDGKVLVCEWYNTPVYDINNNIIGWLSLGKDITSEREEQDKILYLSQHDPLTGLYNRGFIMEQLEVEDARFKRTSKGFSVIILDIDFFKQINDNYGHEAGDIVLKKISDLMVSTVRQTDFVGRWGGEEFVIVLPFTDTDGAHTLAEKIRRNIEDEDFVYKEKLLKVTITAGIACCCRADSIAECIRNADEALLEGKASGRNKVVEVKCE